MLDPTAAGALSEARCHTKHCDVRAPQGTVLGAIKTNADMQLHQAEMALECKALENLMRRKPMGALEKPL